MTSEEIVKALREDCKTCSESLICENGTNLAGLYCANKDAADLIERMTADVADLRKELEWKDMVIALAQRKQAEAEAERDALIEQIKERHDCLDCKHNDFCEFDGADDSIVFDCMNCVQEGCPCAGCFDSSRWEWRGLPEAPEVE